VEAHFAPDYFHRAYGSNRWEQAMQKSGHITPNLLQQELSHFREIKGYLPQIVAVHINSAGEDEIKPKYLAVEKSLWHLHPASSRGDASSDLNGGYNE